MSISDANRNASAPSKDSLRVIANRHPAQIEDLLAVKDQPLLFEGGTALYDAIAETCKQKLSRDTAPSVSRRVVFVITDGEDNMSHVSLSGTTEVAQGEGVPIFALELIPSGSGGRGSGILRRLSDETGGDAVFLKRPGEFLAELVAPLDRQFLLTFTPSQPGDGKLHPLEVKASKGIQIRAPHQYLVRQK